MISKLHHLLFLLLSLLLLTTCKKENLPEYSLKITCQPSDFGRVILSPAKERYVEGTVVRLTPTPNKDCRFERWTGLDATQVRGNTITMDKNINLTARFIVLNTELKITIVEHPKGGQNITSLNTKFVGVLSGKLPYTDVFVDLMWGSSPNSSPYNVGSMYFTMTPSNLAISATYEAPYGYYLTGFFWFRISWTDDYGNHYVESQKVQCIAGKTLNQFDPNFNENLLNGIMSYKKF